MIFSLGKLEVAFGGIPFDECAVDEGELDCSLRFEAEGFPSVLREKGVTRAAVDEKAEVGLPTVRRSGAVDVGDAYVSNRET